MYCSYMRQHEGEGGALYVYPVLFPMIISYVFVYCSYMRQHEGEGGALYVYPALFALTLAVFDLVFLYACFTETLPTSKRV